MVEVKTVSGFVRFAFMLKLHVKIFFHDLPFEGIEGIECGCHHLFE